MIRLMPMWLVLFSFNALQRTTEMVRYWSLAFWREIWWREFLTRVGESDRTTQPDFSEIELPTHLPAESIRITSAGGDA